MITVSLDTTGIVAVLCLGVVLAGIVFWRRELAKAEKEIDANAASIASTKAKTFVEPEEFVEYYLPALNPKDAADWEESPNFGLCCKLPLPITDENFVDVFVDGRRIFKDIDFGLDFLTDTLHFPSKVLTAYSSSASFPRILVGHYSYAEDVQEHRERQAAWKAVIGDFQTVLGDLNKTAEYVPLASNVSIEKDPDGTGEKKHTMRDIGTPSENICEYRMTHDEIAMLEKETIAQAQKKDESAIFVNAEHALDPTYARMVVVDNLVGASSHKTDIVKENA